MFAAKTMKGVESSSDLLGNEWAENVELPTG
jgi:hypothetical protein